MEIPHSVKLFAIPRWFKIAYCLIILVFTLLSIGLLFDVELINSRIHPVRITNKFSGAFGQILAVLIPIILISALVVFSISNEDSIREKSNNLFLKKLPRQLERIPDGGFPGTGRWVDAQNSRLQKIMDGNVRKKEITSSVLIDKYLDDFCCNYLISFPCYKSRLAPVLESLANQSTPPDLTAVLPVRLEINVRKINLGIFFRKSLLVRYFVFNFGEDAMFDRATLVKNDLADFHDRMSHLLAEPDFNSQAILADPDALQAMTRRVEAHFDSSVWVKLIRCFFEHSMGAQSLGEQSKSDHEINGEVRYRMNAKAMEVAIGMPGEQGREGDGLFQCSAPAGSGSGYVGVIYSAIMKPDFLWENSEVLFFCQDLLLMLRSFVNEQPDLFLSEAAEATISQISSTAGGKGMYRFAQKDSIFLRGV